MKFCFNSYSLFLFLINSNTDVDEINALVCIEIYPIEDNELFDQPIDDLIDVIKILMTNKCFSRVIFKINSPFNSLWFKLR